jgi:hypothetical protein
MDPDPAAPMVASNEQLLADSARLHRAGLRRSRASHELLEAEEKVQFLQEKNRELCGVVGSLQVAIEDAKVVKRELEKKIIALTEQCASTKPMGHCNERLRNIKTNLLF